MSSVSRWQTSLELTNAVLGGTSLLKQLVNATSRDDVQLQAVIALENLGSHILCDQRRIAEGVQALNGHENVRLESLKLMIGMSRGDTAKILRKSTSGVKAFLLTAACTTCYEPNDVAQFLFELLINKGILNTVPVSSRQIDALVSVLAGYCHSLERDETFVSLSRHVSKQVDSSTQLPNLYMQLALKPLADIVSQVMSALINEDVDFVSLDGCYGGVFLASMFQWLDSPSTQISILGETVDVGPLARLKINLTGEYASRWQIQTWKRQEKLSELIDTYSNPAVSDGMEYLVPRRAALSVLSHQLDLLDSHRQLLGQLAGALLVAATERGHVCSRDTRFSKDDRSRLVLEICHRNFAAEYQQYMSYFGWDTKHPDFQDGQSRHERHLMQILDQTIFQYSDYNIIKIIVDDLIHIWSETTPHTCTEAFNSGCSACKAGELFEIVPILVAEALYSCLSHNTKDRGYFRGTGYRRTWTCQLDVSGILCSEKGLPISNLIQRNMSDRLGQFIKVTRNTLAASGNGHVAYLSAFLNISTDVRDCCTVCISAGNLRWGTDGNIYTELQQVVDAHPPYVPRATVSESFEPGQVNAYEDLIPKQDNCNSHVDMFISPARQLLQMKTLLVSDRGPQATLSVNWMDSIQGIFQAQLIDPSPMTSHAEVTLISEWQRAGILHYLGWLTPQDSQNQRRPFGTMTETAGNEILQFFAAGLLWDSDLYIRRYAGMIPILNWIFGQKSPTMTKLVQMAQKKDLPWVLIT